MTDVPIGSLPGLPKDAEGPVFREPWEAEAFAMAVRLSEQGLFTWSEWAETLSAEIAAAQADGDPDLGDTYYRHWLNALESLVARKGLVASEGDGPAQGRMGSRLPQHAPWPACDAGGGGPDRALIGDHSAAALVLMKPRPQIGIVG